jgi:hypothetical protein
MPSHSNLTLIQQEPTCDHKILRGSPMMTLSLFTPMCYNIWGLDNGETNPYQHPEEKNYSVKNESHILEPGSVLI